MEGADRASHKRCKQSGQGIKNRRATENSRRRQSG